MQIKIKKLRDCAKIPVRGTQDSAGLDFCAALEEKLVLPPGKSALIPTGLAISLPSNDYVALVFPRSGLAVKHGVVLLNSVGVIDSDYRGELSVGLINQFDCPYTIEPGERIAQMLIVPIAIPELTVVPELDETDRGAGGFGSTGRK